MSSSMEMALKSLRRRKLRTAFTVSGIVVGVSLILVLLSLTNGTSARTSGLINTLSPAQITVVNATGRTPEAGAAGGAGGGFFRGGGAGFGGGGFAPGGGGAGGGAGVDFASFFGSSSTLQQSVVGAVADLTGVSVASPTLSSTGYLNGTAVFLTGIVPSTYTEAAGGLNIVNGTNLSNSTNDQILVGQSLATDLGLEPGSPVTVGANTTGGSQFTVVGIYSTGNAFTERFAYIPLAAAQSIEGKSGQVSEVYVKALNPGDVSTVTSEISASFPGVSAIAPSTFTGAAATLSGTLTSFFTIIGLAALLAGGFGVVNTMMMSISERTREIGALKAIGAKRSQIMRIFMSEAFLIGVIGGLVGVGIGLSVSFALPLLTRAASPTRAGVPGGAFGGFFRGALTPVVTPEIVALSLTLGVVVGVLSGIYPAWRASKMNPVEALKHV